MSLDTVSVGLEKFGVEIITIPHQEQRYDTCGDWLVDHERGRIVIYVSDLGNWKWNMLVAYHELTEVILCLAHGITQEQVDEFDLKYEGLEPGDDLKAPYHLEHLTASRAEKKMAASLGVNWYEYNKAIDSLCWIGET